MIPKKCCKSCRNFNIDFKLDRFCSKYEDYDIDCEKYKSDTLITARGKWINDGDFMITSCCNKVYGIYRFAETRRGIYLPKYRPNCCARMGLDNDMRNLTDEETDIYNNRLEAEAETIDGISLL